MIEFKELSFGYNSNLVFDNTDFKADIGNLTVIKGESGSGKTTLLDIIALKHGNVFKGYYNHSHIQECEYVNNLYYMTQEPLFCDNLKMREQWEILIELYGSFPRMDELISFLGLEDVQNLYPLQLSGGEKLRSAMINIFIIRPQIVLMDEPTASLDDDYKNKFVQLLHILKQNCDLIVSTHDSHIFNESDVLYEIENRKLCLKKSKKIISNNNSILNNQMYKKSNWIFVFLKMKKHHIIKELFTLLLISIPIALFAYSISIDSNFISLFESNLTSLENTHILVYKPLDKRYRSYTYYSNTDQATSFPISRDEYKIIKKIDGIKDVDPKIILPTYFYNTMSTTTVPKFKIYNHNKNIYDYQDTVNELLASNNYDYSQLYIESIEDFEIKKFASRIFNDKSDGIFLNEKLLERCQLKEEDVKGGSVKINIGIPVYDYSGEYEFSAVSDNDNSTIKDDDMIAANGIWYTSKEIILPIRGIIKENSNDLYAPNEKAFYMNSKCLEKLANSHKVNKGKIVYLKDSDTDYVETKDKNEADLTIIYTPWNPNVYTIEVDHVENVENVVGKLEKLGYAVDWKYNDYKLYGESIQYTQKMIHIISVISIVFITFIFLILHYIKGQEEKKLNAWFKSIGCHNKKSLLIIKSQKYFLNTVFVIMLSYLLLWLINIIYLYLSSNLFSIDMNVILTIILVVLLIQYCIPMLWEVFQSDEIRKSYY